MVVVEQGGLTHTHREIYENGIHINALNHKGRGAKRIGGGGGGDPHKQRKQN